MGYNYNKTTLVGRLTRDPEYIKRPDISGLTKFTVAINQYYGEGEKRTEFIPVCLWGKLAEVGGKLLKKGSPILVCGKLRVNRYEKDGEPRRYIEVVAETFQLLEKHDALKNDYPDDSADEDDTILDEEDLKKAA